MPFLEILLPSGHRERIEVSPNTLLITILEDVCIKRGLNYDYCYLTFNRNKIDLSQKFSISRLLNNSKLELIESPISLIDDNVSKIDISLQLSDSSRHNQTFSPKSSILSILKRFAEIQPQLSYLIFPPENTELTAVVFYQHDQIVGEYCLNNVTLSSLGLRSGRALFRLEYKYVDEKDKTIYNEITKKRIEKYLKAEEFRKNKESISTKKIDNLVQSSVVNEESLPSQSNIVVDQLAHTSQSDFVPFSPFSSHSESIFDNNDDSNNKKRESLSNYRQKHKSQTLGELLGINLEQDVHDGATSNSDFVNFKFPEKINDDNREMIVEQKEENNYCKSVSLTDRETVFYHNKPAQHSSTNEDIPDSFFELTEQDLRSIINSYRNVSQSESSLMTSAMREQMRENHFSKYRRCIIQFHFSDSYILQSLFEPKETVGDLYDHLKNFFGNNSSNFHLYTSPPKNILSNRQLNMIQSGLVPMCKVYVSVNGHDLCGGNIDQLLRGDEFRARQIIEKWMNVDNNSGGSSCGGEVSSTVPLVAAAERHVTINSAGNSHKMPKWFKSGK